METPRNQPARTAAATPAKTAPPVVVREQKETKKKPREDAKFIFYPPPEDENSIRHLLALRENPTSTNIEEAKQQSRTLFMKIATLWGKEEFKNSLGIDRHTKCTNCTIKDPCKALEANDIHTLLCEQNPELPGACESCGLLLSMYDPELGDKQKISCFAFTVADSSICKTKSNIKWLTCQMCYMMHQKCYLETEIFNHIRKVYFKQYLKIDSPTYYFPKLDNINERSQSVVMAANKKAGPRGTILRQWAKQEGFVVYELPSDLEVYFIKEREKDKRTVEEKEKELKHIAELNSHVAVSNYFSENDEDIRVKGEIIKRKTTAKKATINEDELYRNNSKYVVFKIPIDPRKSIQKKSLSALALRRMNTTDTSKKAQEITSDNCIYTTKLLSSLEKRFEYDEFIRWALDTLRISTPKFVPKHFDEKTNNNLSSQEDQATLNIIKKMSMDMKTIETEVKKMKTEQKKITSAKAELVSTLRPKILNLLEMNGSLLSVTNHSLVPTISERGATSTKRTIKKEHLAKDLPDCLEKYGFKYSSTDKKEIREQCVQMAEDLFAAVGVQKKETSFTLKYVDPEIDKVRKEKIAASKKKYVNKKKKENEEEKKAAAVVTTPAAASSTSTSAAPAKSAPVKRS